MLDCSLLPDVSLEHPELDEEERAFAAHMKAREEALFRVFGDAEPKGQILCPAEPDLVLNWPGGGVFPFAPARGRTGFHYVTHGLSQPFEDDADETDDVDAPLEGPSGFGIELVLSTPAEASWAPQLLLNFVRYLLFEDDASVFHPGDRIPCPSFTDVAPKTSIAHIVCVESPEYESRLLLPGGTCTLVHLLGVTRAEAERAKSLGPSGPGTEVLFATLLEMGIPPVTDLARPCATKDPRFEKLFREHARKAR